MFLRKEVFLYVLFFITSCNEVDTNKAIVINRVIDSSFTENFYKKDLKNLYPKLLNPTTFDVKKDTVIIKKIKIFKQKLIASLESKDIDWNISESELSVFTRIYFSESGDIEYFSFKISNKNIELKSLLEFKSLIEKSIENKSLGINKDTKYNHCINFTLSI